MAEAQSSSDDPIRHAHYLTKDYSTCIDDYDKRLAVAKETHDRTGQRREHGNLGHAYLYLEDLDRALYHYREAMNIAESLKDGSSLAQMNFVLGRVYNLKQDYEPAIYFHDKHLQLARQLQDSRGQCQAYLILSQLHERINQVEKAKKLLGLHKTLTREVDEANDTRSGTKKNLLKALRTESRSVSLSEPSGQYFGRSLASSNEEKSIPNISRRLKMNFIQHLTKKSPMIMRKEASVTSPDELADLVHRMQRTRFEDQRCSIQINSEQQKNKPILYGHRASTQLDDIMNTVDRLQQYRLDDQRTALPSSSQSNNNHLNATSKPARLSPLNEQFFEQIAKCQESRLDDQRAVLLPLPNHRTSATVSPATTPIPPKKDVVVDSTSITLPDDEFFALLRRVQSHFSRPDSS